METSDGAARGAVGLDGAGPESIVLTPEGLVIERLVVRGTAWSAARHSVEQGRDVTQSVREMLEVGGLFLQHGAAHGLVDSVLARLDGVSERVEAQMRGLQTARVIDARSAGKGTRFQDMVAPVIERCFAAQGDIVDDTSSRPGVLDGHRLKGDFTVTLNEETTGGRRRSVVIEAKDEPAGKLTGKDGALAYLAKATLNRGAEAGVLVYATPTPALAAQRLRLYAGNRLIVLFDKDEGDPLALELACQLARALALHAPGDDQRGLDPALLTERLQRLRYVLDQARCIYDGWKQATKGLDTIREGYDELATEAHTILCELDDRLADGA